MIVQRLRLERGWSQQQLADISGVAVRTIQRIENGQPASIETVKALAAAFEMEFVALREEIMQGSVATQDDMAVERAFEHARNLRSFYTHCARYLLIVAFLLVSWLLQGHEIPWVILPLAGLTLVFVLRWLRIFQLESWFGPAWERKVVERRLDRDLRQDDRNDR